MRTFNEYIEDSFETILESSKSKTRKTRSNDERIKALEKWLKGKKYQDYVSQLNKMIEDPKAKALLVSGFGGELGDTELDMTEESLQVKTLSPTQSEIDVTQSINWELEFPKYIDQIYNQDSIVFNTPLITFRKNYVIDGHHRWSQVFAFNPEAKMTCINYDGPISAPQMLKATQGTIAAVKVENEDEISDPKKKKIPSEVVDGQNIYDDSWDEKAIIKYITKNVGKSFKDKKGRVHEFHIEEAAETLSKYVEGIDGDVKKFAKFVAKNLMQLKTNNSPIEGAPNRGDMPQTDKAGSNGGEENTGPKDKGSALNKLTDDKFLKGAVQ